MSPIQDSAVLLHTRRYSDSRRILILLTQRFGRIDAVQRIPRKKNAANPAQPFTPLELQWRGASSLKTLVSIEASGTAYMLHGNTLYCGFYINEILTRALAAEDPCEALYVLYLGTLERLVKSNAAYQQHAALREFEWGVLRAQGAEFSLEADANGAPFEPATRYRFVTEEGLVALGSADQREGFLGNDLLGITAQRWQEPTVRDTAKRLMRMALRPVIGDKPLNSLHYFSSGR